MSVSAFSLSIYLSRNEALQGKRGYDAEAETEAAKCRQVIVPAVVFKYVSWKRRKKCDHNRVCRPLALGGTLSVAGERGVTSNCKRSADYQSTAHRHVGDPGPAGYGRLFQRAVDKKTVVVADKGCGDTTSEISAFCG